MSAPWVLNISKHNRKEVAAESSWTATFTARKEVVYSVVIYFFSPFFLFAHTMLDGYHHMKKRYLNKIQLRALELKMNTQLSKFQLYKRNRFWFGGVVVGEGAGNTSQGGWLEQWLSLPMVVIILCVSVVAPLIKGYPSIRGSVWTTFTQTDELSAPWYQRRLLVQCRFIEHVQGPDFESLTPSPCEVGKYYYHHCTVGGQSEAMRSLRTNPESCSMTEIERESNHPGALCIYLYLYTQTHIASRQFVWLQFSTKPLTKAPRLSANQCHHCCRPAIWNEVTSVSCRVLPGLSILNLSDFLKSEAKNVLWWWIGFDKIVRHLRWLPSLASSFA